MADAILQTMDLTTRNRTGSPERTLLPPQQVYPKIFASRGSSVVAGVAQLPPDRALLWSPPCRHSPPQ